MSVDTLLARAIAVPVIGRAAIDRTALATMRALIAQAHRGHLLEVAALRAEIAALRGTVPPPARMSRAA